MERAKYKEKTIRLSKLPREKYQLVYESALRGKITCLKCGEPVRLYLGIQKEPHFYHEHKQNCTINELETSLWKPPISVKNSTLFRKKEQAIASGKSGYLQHLVQSGIYLDEAQMKAVSTTEGPLLVLAGAGSGKTRVLTARTAYMICERNIHPSSIMLVTFTTKAAQEMKQRLLTYPEIRQDDTSFLVTGTFHSIFYRMISHFHPERWQINRLLKWDWQREQIIKEAGREFGLDEREFAYDQALQQISYWKNTLLTPKNVAPQSQWEERVSYLYKRYEELKAERGQFDFDDMLLGCYEMLLENPDLLARYQERFHYFLIDEFQDINKVQYEIMKMLSSHTKNLCVVGDDDQSIYAFRGSNPSFILEFDKEYSEAQIITLSENYRSSHAIVTTANKVISFNKHRRKKQMRAQFDNHHLPLFFFPYDEEEEATMVVEDITERIRQGAQPRDFAILYRTHATSRAIFERLSQCGLPFIVEQDGESFYQRRIVRCLLAYLRLSLNPDNEEAMNDLLVALFLKQSALQELKAISIIEDCSLVKALTKLNNIQPFQQKKLRKIVPLFKTLATLKPIVALETIEKEMGFEEFIKKRGNEGNVMEKGSDDLRDLKVVAKKFKTISAFLSHVDEMIQATSEAKQLSKQQTNAVQLTTIHRAKGLEYKYVYILGAVDGCLPHDYALDAYRNGDELPLEEERRLMYVAMTRAKEALFISVPEMRRMKKAHASRFIKSFIE
ncbi:DNA helicase-2/ATP-dependent DNA helicase PcrA [Anoxybacillus calidus]|jgi:DNA helicase II / ATP-dependent DNA helicase PcrA|uniref:DNA 3'-5' helicase n=1 Tax=[Anoxybacillus] calidus TaxID=575178 RepID=A0A7V9Z140_9BACL|nr:competence protein CoiA family protein [Anoxybacillus calidus]MBA2872167.1 DNA helicase-2/ATP-dependent DNA helicase PcrA [Anoxybacillus calidus]